MVSTGSEAGTGIAAVGYTVSPNASHQSRTGYLVVGGQYFTVTQLGTPCPYALSPAAPPAFPVEGGAGSIAVTTDADCGWGALTDAGWILIRSGWIYSNGSGAIEYDVEPNYSALSREGTITAGGQASVISQLGRTCSYEVSPTAQSFPASGGIGTVVVNKIGAVDCPIDVSTGASWIAITGVTAGSPANVSYSVSAHAGPETRTATLTIAGATVTVSQGGEPTGEAGRTFRVSVASDGTPANGAATSPSISANGRYIAFVSRAGNLTPPNPDCGIGPGASLYVHDWQTGDTTPIAACDGSSESPSISGDGRLVAFRSSSSAHVSGDTNNAPDVFVYDRQTGAISRVSVASNGAQANAQSQDPSTDSAGRYVAFSSDATNLAAGDANGRTDVFLHDRQTGQTVLVSVDGDGAQLPNGGIDPAISADGRYVAFQSSSGVWVYDRDTGRSSQVPGLPYASRPSLSAAGRFVALQTPSDTGPVPSPDASVLLHDRQTGITTMVHVGEVPGFMMDRIAPDPVVSADGRYVTFAARTPIADPDDPTVAHLVEVLTYDRLLDRITRVSVSGDGSPGDRSSWSPAISADGNYVAFVSNGTNLVEGDTNAVADVFLRDRQSADSCMYRPSPGQQAFPIAGGQGSFAVIVAGQASCGWEAQSDVPWITVTGDGSGVNVQTVEFTVAPILSSFARTGTITVAGQAFSVMQAGVPCTYRVTPESLTIGAGGGAGSLAVQAAAQDCSWAATATAAWIAITAGGSGVGDGAVSYSVAPNPSVPREGWIRIGNAALRLSQADYQGRVASTTRVSLSTAGGQGNGRSYWPSISHDGRYVAFMSAATDLVAGDLDDHEDAFVRDRATGLTTAVSVYDDVGIRGSDYVAIAAEGRYAAFMHMNAAPWVRDTQEGVTWPTIGGYGSNDPDISGDGRYVAFDSLASDLPGHTTGSERVDVYRFDRQTEQVTCASRSSSGEFGNLSSYWPSLSDDGSSVAFVSSATNLVAGDANYVDDIFVRDERTGQTVRVSVATGGSEANEASYYPAISADGRFVAFNSDATNLVAAPWNGFSHVYVHDRLTSQTTRVSVASDGSPAEGSSYYPSISAEGRFVTFHSQAMNLVAGKTTAQWDVFVHDRQTGETTRVSVASDGSEGNSDSGNAVISGDGRVVAFESWATNLDPSDTNRSGDIYVREWRQQDRPKARLDFTGDLKSDLLWRHAAQGDMWLWPMDGSAHTAETYVRTLNDPNWEIRGLGDQTGDGQADLLWRHAPTGMLYLWTMNGSTVEAETYVGTVDPAYDIVGTGDYNGDGRSDILWRHLTNGELWLWLMDGPATLSVHYVDTVDPAYAVQGSGDLNNDAKADIVWRHAAQGDAWVWLMDGATPVQVAYVTTVSELDYRIVGVADYTGDGQADILWHHATRGEVWLWPMAGPTLLGQAYVATVPDVGYRIAGTGDYDGDGQADILWHHATQGDVWVWLMNGAVNGRRPTSPRCPTRGIASSGKDRRHAGPRPLGALPCVAPHRAWSPGASSPGESAGRSCNVSPPRARRLASRSRRTGFAESCRPPTVVALGRLSTAPEVAGLMSMSFRDPSARAAAQAYNHA